MGFVLTLQVGFKDIAQRKDSSLQHDWEFRRKLLDEHEYIRVVATKIKGFPKEIVVVDETEDELFELL